MATVAIKERPIIFSGPMIRALLDGRKTQARRLMKPQPPLNGNFKGSSFGLSRSVADSVQMYSQNHYDRLPKHENQWDLIGSVGVARDAGFPMKYRCPHGKPGDRLWVRENWFDYGEAYHTAECWTEADSPSDWHWRSSLGRHSTSMLRYAADDPDDLVDSRRPGHYHRKMSSMFMPRWASRITLEIAEVRVQRIQDISESDCWAEGVLEFDGVFGLYESAEMANRLGCCADDARPLFALIWESIHGKGSWDANPWVWAISFRRLEG